MIEQGLVEETRLLLAEVPPPGEQARQALGYAQIIEHLEGRCSLAEAVEQIKIQTRRFAKHQRTWFRRFSDVRWFDIGQGEPSGGVADRISETA
jgi:tRNA dimethylallyltransferase